MTVPSAMAKETTKMKITKNYLRRLIKESIDESYGSSAGSNELVELPDGQMPPRRVYSLNWGPEHFKIVQDALSKKYPGARVIQVMDDGGSATPEFIELVQNDQATENDYIEWGNYKDASGKVTALAFKRIASPSPDDPRYAGYVELADPIR